ncbi:hypothetical protein EV360DRAFT_73033, partial [Lentinula raphanica]
GTYEYIHGLLFPDVDGITSSDNLAHEPYSLANPPPHWANLKVKAITSKLHGGSIKKLQTFSKGGWKEVPEGERWWEEAMDPGALELRRKENLEALEVLRKEFFKNRCIRWEGLGACQWVTPVTSCHMYKKPLWRLTDKRAEGGQE